MLSLYRVSAVPLIVKKIKIVHILVSQYKRCEGDTIFLKVNKEPPDFHWLSFFLLRSQR